MPVRDEKYYFEDGSCVFRVANCLFKIHRSILVQESVFFEKMFSLPAASTNSCVDDNEEILWAKLEGSSDDNPVHCNDTVEAFRTLCWGLYARPTEIRAQDNPDEMDLNHLVLLAHISHKYECWSIQKWATEVMRTHWSSTFAQENTTVADYQDLWTLEILEQLLVFLIKIESTDIIYKKQVEARWLLLAFEKAETPTDLRRALDFADSIGSPRHQGLGYYHALRRLRLLGAATSVTDNFEKIVAGPSQMSKDLMNSLSTEQKTRLTRGLWCLDCLRCNSSLSNMPFLERSSMCRSINSHSQNCVSSWRKFWSSLDHIHDFGKMLELAHVSAKDWRDPWKGSQTNCWCLVKPRIEDMIKKFEDNLPTYFTTEY